MHLLRKYLIAGLLVWLPLAATIFVIKLLIDLFGKISLFFPPELRSAVLFGFPIPGFSFIISILIVLFTGVFVANLFGRRMVVMWEAILNRIPLVSTVYSTVKQVLEILLASNNKSFRQVVLIEYPRKGIWSLGFQTNAAPAIIRQGAGRELSSVFVPTTPNPTSGFIVMIPCTDIKPLAMTVEEAFKFIISMGVIANAENDEAAD